MLTACAAHDRKTRVLVEKPFGFNLKSAQSLNALLLKYFTEDQIYRIDHYVGKETVQNLMVVRFANSLFEPLWNNRFIDHMEISVLEKDGAGGRINFYNRTGAIKDFLQNHIIANVGAYCHGGAVQFNRGVYPQRKIKSFAGTGAVYRRKIIVAIN